MDCSLIHSASQMLAVALVVAALPVSSARAGGGAVETFVKPKFLGYHFFKHCASLKVTSAGEYADLADDFKRIAALGGVLRILAPKAEKGGLEIIFEPLSRIFGIYRMEDGKTITLYRHSPHPNYPSQTAMDRFTQHVIRLGISEDWTPEAELLREWYSKLVREGGLSWRDIPYRGIEVEDSTTLNRGAWRRRLAETSGRQLGLHFSFDVDGFGPRFPKPLSDALLIPEHSEVTYVTWELPSGSKPWRVRPSGAFRYMLRRRRFHDRLDGAPRF